VNATNQNTTLLVMDMQDAIVRVLPVDNETTGKIAKAIAYARAKNITVIYVVLGFRLGMPEVSSNNKAFSASKEKLGNVSMAEFMKIHDDVAPLPDEVIITKRRYSAFTGSDLEVVLRSQNIQHVVVTGYSTSGVVLSTVREAADKDFRINVLSDGCADTDPEVHQVLTTKIFPKQADVLTVGEWIKS